MQLWWIECTAVMYAVMQLWWIEVTTTQPNYLLGPRRVSDDSIPAETVDL